MADATGPEREEYGPRGDAARHLPLAELEAGFRGLAPAPTDAGRLAVIAFRRADGVRETPSRVRLTREEGVPGDRWGRLPPRDPDMQLAVIRRDVAELIANGQPLPVFGDNLFVELDLSERNLPVGSRLEIGGAVVEVTPMPHEGCAKFRGRFGADALRFVSQKTLRDQRLRGIYWKVVEPAEVAVDDPIRVVSRG